MSEVIGGRWFREGGGMPPMSLAEPSGRYLSFVEREEIAILRAQGHAIYESGVSGHDIIAIIRTHAKDRKVAAWLEDTAEAFEEIGEIDLAIDWAKQATDFDRGHQSLKAADYWCRLLEEHRPAEALEARLLVFRRWPSSTTAARLHNAAGRSWSEYRDEVDELIAELRETHRRRPRLQQEFDRAGLP